MPPDGGWGWLVLLASVMVNFLIPGTVKSFGVLFVEFLEVFDASPAAAAWIPALCYFLYSSLGKTFLSLITLRLEIKLLSIASLNIRITSIMIITVVTGPLSSILSVKYSYRTVTLLGGTFAAVGMMLSYFANSVAFLCVR